MWLIGQGCRCELPKRLEGWIMQLQAAVAAKHGNAFAQSIERFTLYAHQGIVT